MKNMSTLLQRVAMIVLVNTLAITSIAAGDPPNGDKLRMNEIKARAARDFAGRFPFIDNERWYKYNTGFSAKFSQNSVMNNVYYDRSGYYITTIRYYKERNIPNRLKKLVQKAFTDYTIVSATEVITTKESSFQFNLKNKARIKTVKLTEQELEVTGDYRNGELDL